MKIAITYENGEVFQHFGHTEKVKIYEIEEGKVAAEHIVDTSANGHEKLVNFLKEKGIEVLICGGIGAGAQNALIKANIQLCGGVSGNADEVIQQYLAGKLKYKEEANCNHHHMEGEHHCENHNRCTKNN